MSGMVWLTGCNGMLGSEVKRTLQKCKLPFIATGHETDITDYETLKEYVTDKDVTWIVNCAAYTDVKKAEKDEENAYFVNVTGADNLARIAHEKGSRLIHISTDYVFEGNGTTPLCENEPVCPLNAYGRTKDLGEDKVRNNCEAYYVLRTSWLYGWTGSNFVYTMLRSLSNGNPISVVSDQIGSPTCVTTVAQSIAAIIQNETIPFGIYHCADNGFCSWYDFACAIQKTAMDMGLLNSSCNINPCLSSEYTDEIRRPSFSALNAEKLQTALKIRFPNWKESLSFFLTNPLFDRQRIE